MNTLRYSLLLLLGGLLSLVLDSCRSTSEAPQLVVNEGKASQPLVARSEGDTLRIPFTSSIYDHRLQITEAEDWIDTKLERGMLLIYVARNSSPTKRTAQLTLQIIERGERREAQHITVVQPASVSLASDRYLFAYTSALQVSEDYFYHNPGIVFTLPLPASASLFETKEAFRTNLDATRLTTQLEYGSESRDWIHDLKFTRQGDIWGLSFRLDAIPQSLEQRRVRLRLSDPEHPNLSVALDFLQIRRRRSNLSGHSLSSTDLSSAQIYRSRSSISRPTSVVSTSLTGPTDQMIDRYVALTGSTPSILRTTRWSALSSSDTSGSSRPPRA